MPEDLTLTDLVTDVAWAIAEVDRSRPVWRSARTGKAYQAGIGPHPEAETVRMVSEALQKAKPRQYSGSSLDVPYPEASRQRCDWVIGDPPTLAVEVKMLRLMGDNGKPNDNMLMHILSPYPQHRSALTDIDKLSSSGFGCLRAILIYGFDYPSFSMEPALTAFEMLANDKLASRVQKSFTELVHPIHATGSVAAWGLGAPQRSRLDIGQ